MRANSALLIFLASPFVAAQTCYFQYQATVATGLVPCGSTTSGVGVSCCGSNSYCLSDGLCFDPGSLGVYRGGCTDSSWVSGNCADVCTKYGISVSGLWPCGSNYFSCDQNACNASFYISGASIEANGALSSALSLVSTAAATSLSSSTATATVTVTGPATTATVTSLSSTGVSKGDVAAVGAGVGGGMLILLIIALVFLLLERKKNQNRQYQPTPAVAPAPAPVGYPPQQAYYDKPHQPEGFDANRRSELEAHPPAHGYPATHPPTNPYPVPGAHTYSS